MMMTTRYMMIGMVITMGCSTLAWCAEAKVMRVACVGDSLTSGFKMENPAQEAYPAQLGKLLGETYDVQGFAVPGHTALRGTERPLWVKPEFQAAQDFKPDIVVIILGSNDSWPTIWAERKGDFEKDLTDLVNVFAELPSKPKCILGLPLPFFIDDEHQKKIMRDEVNVGIQNVAKALSIPVIDMYTPFLDRPELVMTDKVHPLPSGAKEMAELVAEAIGCVERK